MKKSAISFALLLSASTVSHAGFFDSIFGGKEEKQEAPAQQTASETTSSMETASNIAMGLLPQLTQQLGVTDAQAQGGLGALMQTAKGTLSTNEFSQLSSGVPGMETLLAAAPALSGKGGAGALTNALSNAGGMASSLGSLGALTQQFESLGLSPDMMGKFATIAVEYFTSGGQQDIGTLLQKGLGAILG